MSKSELIDDQDSLNYKQRLADFMAEVNPKPTLADLERLKQKYLDKRVQND